MLHSMTKIETALSLVILLLTSPSPTLYTSNPRAVKYTISAQSD